MKNILFSYKFNLWLKFLKNQMRTNWWRKALTAVMTPWIIFFGNFIEKNFFVSNNHIFFCLFTSVFIFIRIQSFCRRHFFHIHEMHITLMIISITQCVVGNIYITIESSAEIIDKNQLHETFHLSEILFHFKIY